MRHFSKKTQNRTRARQHGVQRHFKIIRIAKSKSDAAFRSEVRTDVMFEF